LEDLRDSGRIEEDADVVIFIHRASLYDKEAPANEADIIVGKAREADEATHTVKWNGSRTEFYEEQGSFA
jgi:replicative DNA helicase